MSALFAAMAAAFPEIEGALKDRNNPAFKSKYADLSSVVDAVKPALAKHKLFFVQLTHEQAGYNWHGMTNSTAPLNQPREGVKAAPRFGGGWKYNLGFQFSGRTLLIELLFGMLRFNIETAKDRRDKAEIDRILNRSTA